MTARLRRTRPRRHSAAPARSRSRSRLARQADPLGIGELNRVAGNRAVGRLLAKAEPGVQRLYYDPLARTLHVPPSFAATTVHWDATNKVKWNTSLDKAKKKKADGKEVEVSTEDKTFADLYASDKAVLNNFLTQGLGGEAVGTMAVHKNYSTLIGGLIGAFENSKDAAPVGKELAGAFRSLKQVLMPKYGRPPYYSKEDVADDLEWGLAPDDYIPELPDLPGAKKPVAKFWGKTCTLIALVKEKGAQAAFAKAKVRNPANTNLDTAVQALHDYYMNQSVQYDDESTRQAVMKDWGYRNIFTGPADYTQLPGLVDLDSGSTYILDIKGHTVKVTMKKDVKANTVIDDVGKFFTFDSDPGNYKDDESTKKVLRIYEAT